MPRSTLTCYACRLSLLIAICVSPFVTPLRAQDTVDPSLELYFSANAVYNRKQYPLAIPIYTEFLSKHGEHEKAQLARYGLGMCRFAMKEYDQALIQFDALVKEENLDAKIARDRLVLLHAQCLLFTNQKDEALKQLLASADTLKPGIYRTGLLAAITDLYFSRADWPNTMSWAKQLREAKPSPAQSIRAGYQEGYALYKLNKMQEAIAILDTTKAQAVAAKDEAWATRIGQLLGECHISNQDLDRAMASLQATLPNLKGKAAVDARYRLAAIKYSRKQWAEAQTDYESFLEASKDDGETGPKRREASFRVARCMIEQAEYAKARTTFAALTEANDEIAARSLLWQGRAITRDKDPKRFELAAAVLQQAAGKPWYQQGFPDSKQTIVADIDFEHANALMLQASPKWDEAHKLLQRVQQRRGDYRHMTEVLSQQAICLHKLGDFPKSLAATTAFLDRYSKDALVGDVRFLHAENLFLMKKLKEANAAFREFAVTHKEHSKRWSSVFRLAQILHYQEKWAESNKIAVPLLEKKLSGDLFSPLAFVVGENYFRLGKWSDAIAPLEAYLATNTNPQKELQKGVYVDAALLQLGIACSRVGKKEDALRHLGLLQTTYTTETPHLPLALAEQGKLYYELGKMDQSRASLETFIKYHADKQLEVFNSNAASELGRVHYYLGWLDAAADRHAEAAANFDLAVKNSRGRRGKSGGALEADALLQQGIALVNAEDFEQAAKHLQSMAQKFKEHPQIGLVKYYTGLAYARSKKWPQAASYFGQVLQTHPDVGFADKALYELAWCEREQKRNKQATERYEMLLANYPKSALLSKVQSELADLNLDVGAQKAVIARLTETMKTVKDPKLKFDLQYQLASAYFKTKDYEKSAPMFEALIAGGKQSELLPSILFQAGESRLALTETVAARDHYLAASQIPNVPASLAESILLRLGETQNITGQHQQAQASYDRFLKEYRESQWTRNAQYGLAYAMEKQQDYENAIGEYAKLLPSGPNRVKMDKWLVQGRYQIGECYFNLQQYDKAIVEFASVDATARGYPEWQAKAVLEMGRVSLSQGNKADAADRMKEVMQRFPKTMAAGVAQKYLDEIRSGG